MGIDSLDWPAHGPQYTRLGGKAAVWKRGHPIAAGQAREGTTHNMPDPDLGCWAWLKGLLPRGNGVVAGLIEAANDQAITRPLTAISI